MNNIIQYILILGVVTLFFGVFYALGMDKLAETSQSQSKRLQNYKQQVLEELTLIEMTGLSNPVQADVMNTGGAPIVIKRVLAGGVDIDADDYDTLVWNTGTNATIPTESTSGVLEVGQITRITVDNGTIPLFVVSENDRMFVFGAKR